MGVTNNWIKFYRGGLGGYRGLSQFGIQFSDWNQIFFLVSISHLFQILCNITTEVGAMCRLNGCKYIIYSWFVVINLCIGTKYLCCEVVRCEYV